MTTIAFDTLQFANRLKAAGVPSAHAEAEASALAEVFSDHRDYLATKQDMAQLEANMEKLEAHMATKQDLAQLEANMEKLEANMATKQDMEKLDARIERIETAYKQDFARLEVQIEQRATKADLQLLETRMHGEISALSHQMGLLRWMMGLMVAGLGSLIVKAFVLPGA